MPNDIDQVRGNFHCLVVILLFSLDHGQDYLVHDFGFFVSGAAHPELVEQSTDYHGFKQQRRAVVIGIVIHAKKYGAYPNLVYMIVGDLHIESCHGLPPLG
jgi:hypothetical protein